MTLRDCWLSFDECFPLVGEAILVRWPDGSIEVGRVGSDGLVYWLGVSGGDETMSFLRDDGARWRYVAID